MAIEVGASTAPGITLVVIGLNVERFLPDCLDSVRRADYPDDRLQKLYVDSGSTDRSRDIAASQDGWEVLVLDDPRPSVAKGRNLGLRHARHELVQFLDADMLLDARWLSVASDALQSDSRTGAVFGRTIERYPRRNLLHGMRDALWSMHPLGESDRMPGASMVRQEAVRTTGDHRADVRGFEDVELAHRLRAAGYVIRGLPETMCLHDSDMSEFAEYWRRNVFAGAGNVDILLQTRQGSRRYFLRELRRSLAWPLLLLLAAIASVATQSWLFILLASGLFGLAVIRELVRGWRVSGRLSNGVFWAAHWVLSKPPYSIGVLRSASRVRRSK